MLFHENQHKIRSLLRDCTEAEKNGHGQPHGYHGAKYVPNPVTVQDLDRLYDQLTGAAVDDAESDCPRDPETEAWLDQLYDDILAMEEQSPRRNSTHASDG
jgi:hypothetical protein